MRLPITPYGRRELLLVGLLLLGALVTALFFFSFPWSVAGLAPPALGLLFLLAFFRDPKRTPPPDASLVVSPADGTVADIVELPSHPNLGEALPIWRIGIFLSVFNVHINRIPLSGQVQSTDYTPGGYLDARDPGASAQNESMDLRLLVEDVQGGRFSVLVRQIAGLIARRIICPARPGEAYERGQRFGMIKFGSRTELLLPVERVEHLAVTVGERVQGGASVLARLKVPVKDPPHGSGEAHP